MRPAAGMLSKLRVSRVKRNREPVATATSLVAPTRGYEVLRNCAPTRWAPRPRPRTRPDPSRLIRARWRYATVHTRHSNTASSAALAVPAAENTRLRDGSRCREASSMCFTRSDHRSFSHSAVCGTILPSINLVRRAQDRARAAGRATDSRLSQGTAYAEMLGEPQAGRREAGQVGSGKAPPVSPAS